MLIAIIGDVHGNLPALNAVLDDIDNAGIQTVLNTGDSVVGFPWPNEVIGLLRERGIPSVQGEMDRAAAGFLRKTKHFQQKWPAKHFAALQWTYENLSSANIEFLAGLPHQRRLTFEGIELYLCHGTPGGGQTDSLASDDEEELFLRQREVANTPLIVCGRTHVPLQRHVLGSLFVNPGSVGWPAADDNRATYALLSTEEETWTAEPQRVEYDFESALARIDELKLPRPV